MIYKLQKTNLGEVCSVTIIGEQISIPFDPANTDYANFKKEVLAGAELQDADGNVMTQEQVNQFVGGLA